jgi:hypothetical protein
MFRGFLLFLSINILISSNLLFQFLIPSFIKINKNNKNKIIFIVGETI